MHTEGRVFLTEDALVYADPELAGLFKKIKKAVKKVVKVVKKVAPYAVAAAAVYYGGPVAAKAAMKVIKKIGKKGKAIRTEYQEAPGEAAPPPVEVLPPGPYPYTTPPYVPEGAVPWWELPGVPQPGGGPVQTAPVTAIVQTPRGPVVMTRPAPEPVPEIRDIISGTSPRAAGMVPLLAIGIGLATLATLAAPRRNPPRRYRPRSRKRRTRR